MDLTRLRALIGSCRYWITERLYQPVLTRIAVYLCHKANLHPQTGESPDTPSLSPEVAWKGKAISDFSAWLAQLPEELPKPEAVTMESCDLYTLLTEFIALRQEIKLQNREQHQVIRIQQTLMDGHKEVADLFERKTRELEKLEENIRRACEKRTVEPFLDTRDALCRGLASARRAASARGIFRRPPKHIGGVVSGYEMALRRFDRALSYVGILPVETVGKLFDPGTMQAIDQRFEQGGVPGSVIEEHLCGFVRGKEIIRTAQVVIHALE